MDPVETPHEEAPSDDALSCPACGSANLRRSAPHGLTEQLIRSFTPYHFYRCRACGRRGRYLGKLAAQGGRAGRPAERRDGRAAQARRIRIFVSFVLSLALGVAAAIYLQRCEQRSEEVRPRTE